MSNEKRKDYCLVDHANKQADRKRLNPNLRRSRVRDLAVCCEKSRVASQRPKDG